MALNFKTKANTDINIDIYLADPEKPAHCRFVGREAELRMCKAAFGINTEDKFDDAMTPLHFRLEGPPGVGKNEIVYEIARNLAKSMNLPFYSIQGHEEMTPEDLSLLIVPDPDANAYSQFRLQASPLASALHEGGLFFFDEINRVPERALTPLASVLDKRRSLYSATTGITITPKDDKAKSRFRFCCALNPKIGDAGHGVLPDYIDERTLPVIKVGYPDFKTLEEILRKNINSDDSDLESLRTWYSEQSAVEISIRQLITLMSFALRTKDDSETLVSALRRASKEIFRPEQLGVGKL